MQITPPAVHIAPVLSHSSEEPFDDIRTHRGVVFVPQSLTGDCEIEGHRLAVICIRRLFPHECNQIGFQTGRAFEPDTRHVCDTDMDENGNIGIVIRDAQRLQIGQSLAQGRN